MKRSRCWPARFPVFLTSPFPPFPPRRTAAEMGIGPASAKITSFPPPSPATKDEMKLVALIAPLGHPLFR